MLLFYYATVVKCPFTGGGQPCKFTHENAKYRKACIEARPPRTERRLSPYSSVEKSTQSRAPRVLQIRTPPVGTPQEIFFWGTTLSDAS